MQKQGLDNFKTEESLSVILLELVTLIPVISPVKRRSLPLLVRDWALTFGVSLMLADLTARRKDGWLVVSFPTLVGAQTVDSRGDFSDSSLVEDDVVRVWCVVSFGISLAGLRGMLADIAGQGFDEVMKLFALARLVSEMQISTVDVIGFGKLQV